MTFSSGMQSNVLKWILEIYAVFRKCMTRFPFLYCNMIYVLILDALESPRLPKIPNYSKLDIFEILEKNFQTTIELYSQLTGWIIIWLLFINNSHNSAYFLRPITLELLKSPNSNCLKLTVKDSTVLWSPLYIMLLPANKSILSV